MFGRAHGRLFDAVTNLKAKYRRNKIYQPRARRSLEKTTKASVQYATTNKRTAPDREDPEITSESEADLNTEIEECFEWLRSSAVPSINNIYFVTLVFISSQFLNNSCSCCYGWATVPATVRYVVATIPLQ